MYEWFVLDRALPAIDSHTVSPASPSGTQNVIISGNAIDVLKGLADIKIYLDGISKQICNLAGETIRQPCSIGAGILPAGIHTYSVTAIDRATNVATTSEKSFTVAN